MNRWVTHFKGDITNRIPNSQISVSAGLKDTRLFQLKSSVSEQPLIVVLAKQIESLKDFLNVKSNLTSEQILDTSELILSDFDDMSFTAIMDCFNSVKKGKKPFNDTLYEALDGRKILMFLDKYRDHQIEHLETVHADRKQLSEFKFRPSNNTAHIKDCKKLLDTLKKVSPNIKPDRVELENDDLVLSWIKDFEALCRKDEKLREPGHLDNYLQERMEVYNKQQKNESKKA